MNWTIGEPMPGTLKQPTWPPANLSFLKDALTTFYELALGRTSLFDAIGIH